MKKATLFAAALLAGTTMMAGSLQTQAAQMKVISTGKVATVNVNTWKDYLEDCQWEDIKVIAIPCQPSGCGAEKPDANAPGTSTPETNTPESAPETNTPEISAPETNTPESAPETGTPETSTPESTPETGTPESTPETNVPDQSVHAYVQRIVDLVNEERAKVGAAPLTLQADITAAAQVRAVETETLFSHTRPDGTKFSTALTEAGVSYRGAGENIAWGQKTPEQVMEGWMNSAGHRANILNEKYTSIGVGYHQNAAGVNYWSQLFTY